MVLMNGQLPASMLTTIPGGNGRQLRIDLIPQTVALMAAFEARFGKTLQITDGYRDYAGQVRLKALKGAFAAEPGFSRHGWGEAIDFGSGVERSFTSQEHLWMRQNAPLYGWRHPLWAHNHNNSDGMDEPWHFEGVYVSPDTYAGTTEEDDMAEYGPAILAALQGLAAAMTNVESILTAQGGNGIRGDVHDVGEVATKTHLDLLTGIDELRAVRVRVDEVMEAVKAVPAPSGTTGSGATKDQIRAIVSEELAKLRLTTAAK